MGEGLGGTVAANMAAHHPSDFNHMVSFFVIGIVSVCFTLFVCLCHRAANTAAHHQNDFVIVVVSVVHT